MKVLMLHCRYMKRGGEDLAVESEEQLLSTRGHSVFPYRRNNAEIEPFTIVQKAALPLTSVWSSKTLAEVRRFALNHQPDVAHFHNTFPLISPSAYSACRSAGIPVVQTLHNYRLVCPGPTPSRGGKPCECCTGKGIAWPAVRYACYRGIRRASGTAAAMPPTHLPL